MDISISGIVRATASVPVGIAKLVTGIDALHESRKYAALAEAHPEAKTDLTPKEARDIGWRFGILGQNAANIASLVSGLNLSGAWHYEPALALYQTPFNPVGIAIALYASRGLFQYFMHKERKELAQKR